MVNSETGETNNANRNLETEGLSGIKLSIENDIYLYVDGMPTSFSKGNGTRKEPLIPLGNVHLRDALENAKDIAELAEEHDLERTMFLRHNDRLFGVDSDAHVQLVRGKKWSDEQLQGQIIVIQNLLNSMRDREGIKTDSDKWTLSIVDEE